MPAATAVSRGSPSLGHDSAMGPRLSFSSCCRIQKPRFRSQNVSDAMPSEYLNSDSSFLNFRMRNIALRIEYDGTDFVGSQWQNNGRSVQGELEGAWEQLTQDRRRVNMAGRTDAGVHARGQVANVRTETELDLATLKRGLNAILPEDIGVLEAWEVDHDFHARHTAVRRDYRFLIDRGPVASPLLRRQAIHSPRPVDAVAMQ